MVLDTVSPPAEAAETMPLKGSCVISQGINHTGDAEVDEKISLVVDSQVPCYDAVDKNHVDVVVTNNQRSSSIFSALDRRYSTARLGGIMIPKNFWKIVQTAVFTVCSSIAVIFANRALFSGCKFPLLTAQLFQAFASVIFSAFFGWSCKVFIPKNADGKQFWPSFSWSPSLALRLLPLTVVFIPRILFTNGALGATQVSTYQITRQSAIIFSVLFSMAILRYRPSFLVFLSCGIIVAGVVVVGFDPRSLSLEGLLWGLAASGSAALYLVIVKFFLPIVDGCTHTVINYTAIASIPFLISLIFIFGEWQTFLEFLPGGLPEGRSLPNGHSVGYVWMLLSFSLVSSFLVNVSSMLLVKAASPVTYDVVGTFKGIVQCAGGMAIMGDTQSVQNYAGIVLSLVGGLLYTKAKHMEHVAKVKADALEKKRFSKLRKHAELANAVSSSSDITSPSGAAAPLTPAAAPPYLRLSSAGSNKSLSPISEARGTNMPPDLVPQDSGGSVTLLVKNSFDFDTGQSFRASLDTNKRSQLAAGVVASGAAVGNVRR